MLSKEEIKKWILENCMDEEGRIDLSGLDFSDVKADVDISHMKVNGDLYQNWQKVKGDLNQSFQAVYGYIEQGMHTAGHNIYQNEQTCDGSIIQDEQWCSKNLNSGRETTDSIEEEIRRKQNLKRFLENGFDDFKK